MCKQCNTGDHTNLAVNMLAGLPAVEAVLHTQPHISMSHVQLHLWQQQQQQVTRAITVLWQPLMLLRHWRNPPAHILNPHLGFEIPTPNPKPHLSHAQTLILNPPLAQCHTLN